MLAAITLMSEIPVYCKILKAELQNYCNLGNSQYPTGMRMIMRILQKHVTTKGANNNDKDRDTNLEGASYF